MTSHPGYSWLWPAGAWRPSGNHHTGIGMLWVLGVLWLSKNLQLHPLVVVTNPKILEGFQKTICTPLRLPKKLLLGLSNTPICNRLEAKKNTLRRYILGANPISVPHLKYSGRVYQDPPLFQRLCVMSLVVTSTQSLNRSYLLRLYTMVHKRFQ